MASFLAAPGSFLAIPLKETSKLGISRNKSILKDFKHVFLSGDSDDQVLDDLNNKRMNFTWRTLDECKSALEFLTGYYDQLNYIDAKYPSAAFQISVKWKDAFNKGDFFPCLARLSLSTLAYEKECILFNIGAMQSQIACRHINDTKNDEGLKLAAKYFQLSSGTFQDLNRIATSVVEERTLDLCSDTLSALHALMLAQAQECFFKATADNMKESIVAKVASHAEELYSDTLKLMQKETVHHLWEKDWTLIISGKQASYRALAEYYQSLVCRTNKEFGEEIARLQKALELLKNADAKDILAPDFKEYMARINHNYEEAKNFNDLGYHAKIPDYKSLTPIGKTVLAKPIMPGEKLNPSSYDVLALHQAMSIFDVRKAELVKSEKAKLKKKTKELKSILASLNLPAAIEDTTGNCLPQSLKEKSEAVRAKGGIDTIQYLLNELPSLLQRNSEILKECERMLNDEKESDNELRSKFGSKWVRTPSAKLNEPLKSNLQKYKRIISIAMSADGIVKEKYEKHREKIAMLCLPEDQLLSSYSSVDKLKHLMLQVVSLKSERESLMGELKSAAMDMRVNFVLALSSEGWVNEEALPVETLGKIYGPIQKKIRENISKQEQLVPEIQRANNEFLKEKNSDGSGVKREESMLSDLAEAHDAYMNLIGNLEEGFKFYNNLTEVLVSFQNKISDFCFARNAERDELCKSLQKNIVSAATHPSPLQPPSTEASKPKPATPPSPKAEPASVAPPNYGQIVMPPFPPAPGYQGAAPAYPYPPGGCPLPQSQFPQSQYPYPQQQQPQQYPYPQQQYRPQ